MPDPVVSKFKVKGEIAVWSYDSNRNYPGWNFSCDVVAAKSLLELIDLMKNAKFPARKKFIVSSNPQLTMAPGCRDIPQLARTFEIRYSKENSPNQWDFSISNGHIVLALGSNTITEFQNGVSDILKGEGDYSIGHDPCLWFWWSVNP